MADANYSNVVLLLPMSGADGGTTFTDYSPTLKTVTRYGDAHTETDQSKFYGSSGYFDGGGDYLSAPNSSDFNFGTGDFTVEFWLYCPNTWSSNSHVIVGQKASDTSDGWVIYRDGFTPNKLTARFGIAGGSNNLDLTTASNIPSQSWLHFALTRASSVSCWYINGVKDAETANSNNIQDTSALLKIGTADSWSNVYFKGYLQDLRITKGVARYTDTFTPPGKLIGSISGTIYDANGDAAQRTVIAVPRSYPNSRTFTTQSSAANGTYSLSVPDVECSRIVLADETTLYNDIVDRVLPG